MSHERDLQRERRRIEIRDAGSAAGNGGEDPETEDETFRVDDRRHWKSVDSEEEEPITREAAPRPPSLIDEYRQRTEAAEQKLQEYIEAFKGFKQEQEDFRARLNRDVDRRVELKFGQLVEELLGTMDDLDLALQHAVQVPEAEPLARGVALARRRFLETLERHGVERIDPADREFDPNESEALRVDPVDSPERAGMVTHVLRPGYRLGDRIIRAARVAVGRYDVR